ncbi:MAG: hypothetical protein LLF94_12180 [Chlamydiales bacterium]|nr:hypothetical protein [Chlamydiales bacterium]
MAIAANSYSSYNIVGDADCVICRDPLHGTVMAHDKKHPVHEACIKQWLIVQRSCPVCRQDIDIRSLFSWRKLLSHEIQDVPRVAGGIAGICALFGSLFMQVPDERPFTWTKTIGCLLAGPEIIRRCCQHITPGQREFLNIYHLGVRIGVISTMAGVGMLGFNIASLTGDIAEEITGLRILRPLGFAVLPSAVSLTTYIAKKIL